MAISKKDQQELDQLYYEYRESYGGLKEDYFAFLYMTKKLKVNIEDIKNQVAFGNRDYGIDAYYLDRLGRNLYLYQFKWSENHNLFKESLERLASSGIDKIFGDSFQDPEQNEFLRYLKADIYEHQSLVDRIYIHFVFKGDIEGAENSAGLQDRRENLENKKWIIDKYYGDRQVALIFEFISDKRPARPPQFSDTHYISLSKTILAETNDIERKMYVGFVPLNDLYKIYQSIGQKFFNRNIRAGLSPENPPNKKIRDALSNILKKQLPVEHFTFNHNGVTIAAEHLNIEDGKAEIKVPRLLNGAQTITSFSKFVEEFENNPIFRQNSDLIENIKVLAKIIVYDPWSDFVSNVTICNNQQNPVEPWNLRANDRIQCDLQDKFREQLGIFYSRQENAFQNLTDSDLAELGVEDSRDLKIKILAQTFLSSQGEIDKVSRLPEVFENPKTYNETFRESYLRSDARRIILAYKTHLVLNSPLKKLEEMAPKKISYAIGRSRNLICALLIQAVINDNRLGDLLESYGNTLAKEADFRVYLQKIAANRILPIIKNVFAIDSYSEKIINEKYSFLRTKEVYRRCMDEAYERYDWKKLNL